MEQQNTYSLESEQELLGALLLDNAQLEEINRTLTSKHFYDPSHGKVFDAIKTLSSRGSLANSATLAAYGPLKDVDNEYLKNLEQCVLSIGAAPEYSDVVVAAFQKREVIQFANDLSTTASQSTGTLDEMSDMIEGFEQKIFSLTEAEGIGSKPKTLSGSLMKALEKADRATKSPDGITGVSTGLGNLDKIIGGLQKPDLNILAARPAMGKTALALSIAFGAAKDMYERGEESSVLFFSLEMSADQLANRILSMQASINSEHIRRGMLNGNDFAKLTQTCGEIENAPLYIDDSPSLSVSQVLTRSRRHKRQHGLGLVVVDYLQLLNAPDRYRDQNRVVEISVISRTLKAIAKELDVPVLCLSQLSRGVESRDDKRPLLSDLRDSGAIEQDADIVMFIFREEYYLNKSEPIQKENEDTLTYNVRVTNWDDACERAKGKAEIIVSKNRQGGTGTAKAYFNAPLTQFTTLADADDLPETNGELI